MRLVIRSVLLAGVLYPSASFADQTNNSASSLLPLQSIQAGETLEPEVRLSQTNPVGEVETNDRAVTTETANPLAQTPDSTPDNRDVPLPTAVGEVETKAQEVTTPTNPLAQTTPSTPDNRDAPLPTREQIEDLDRRLNESVQEEDRDRGVPAYTLVVPSGYGADRNIAFVGVLYTPCERIGCADDGVAVVGIGLLDAVKSVGVEVSYTIESLTADYRGFGEGSFNIKVHRQFPEAGVGVAVGYNGLINIGGDLDFANSPYAAVTKIFVLRPDLDKPFSRLALTGGVGTGIYRSAQNYANDEGLGVFGSAAVRIIRPLSAIVEWTGRDLEVGLSITPFGEDVGLQITPSIRDIAGSSDSNQGAQFDLQIGYYVAL